MKFITALPMFAALTLLPPLFGAGGGTSEDEHYYCEYCGHRFPSVRLLTSTPCPRHPYGKDKGKHKLYEGREKSEYTCKYCGRHFPSIMLMTAAPCLNHPKGENEGNHSPAL